MEKKRRPPITGVHEKRRRRSRRRFSGGVLRFRQSQGEMQVFARQRMIAVTKILLMQIVKIKARPTAFAIRACHYSN